MSHFRLVYEVPIRKCRIGASITLANPFLFFYGSCSGGNFFFVYKKE